MSDKVLVNLIDRNVIVRRKPTPDNQSAFVILKPMDNPHAVDSKFAEVLFDRMLAAPVSQGGNDGA